MGKSKEKKTTTLYIVLGIVLFVALLVFFIFSGDNLELIKSVFIYDVSQEVLEKQFDVIDWHDYTTVIFLSALQKVDKPVYEAAKIDGASKWAQFWKITLPTLRPMIIVNMLYTIVSISSFELNDVIVLIQTDSFAANYGLGYASALSFLYFIVLMLIMALFVGIYGLRSPTDRKIAKEARQMVKQLEKIHRIQSKGKRAR